MESRDIEIQQSRLAIITWTSFTIALIYFFNCLAGLTSTSFAHQLQSIQKKTKPNQELDTLVDEISYIQFQENILNSVGLICASLFIIAVIALQLKKIWGAKLYMTALFTALFYNLIDIYIIYTQNYSQLPSSINGLYPEDVDTIDTLEMFFSSINFGTGLIFFVIALSYLMVNFLFFKNGKTKYILKHPENSEQ